MAARKYSLATILIAGLLICFSALAVFSPPAKYSAYMTVTVPDNLLITFFLKGRVQETECGATIDNMSTTILASCPTCRITQSKCFVELQPTERSLLLRGAADDTLAHLPNGVAYPVASSEGVVSIICREGSNLAGNHTAASTCVGSSALRVVSEDVATITAVQNVWSLFGLILAALGSWATCWFIIRYEHLHAHLSHDTVGSGPQKFHSRPTPRIGGIALVGGLLASGGIFFALNAEFNATKFAYLLLAGSPAFLGGLAEDVTKAISVRDRLLMTMLAGSVGAWLLGAVLNRLDIPGIDTALLWLPFAVALTAVAVGGVANSINIIDGYNGLAGGFAVIVLAAMAWVAAQVGDGFILASTLILIGALLGFLAWNWPTGRIFLGDGGAYLLGFLLAELSVMLVIRNPQVSPWFPFALLAYPIFETLFSIYRKKFLRGFSPGRPDGLHMHMLIYKRLIPKYTGSKNTRRRTKRNSLVAPYILRVAILYAAFSAAFYQSTQVLILGIAFGSLMYVYLYSCITTWSIPKWLSPS